MHIKSKIKVEWFFRLALLSILAFVALPAAIHDGGFSGITLYLERLSKNAFIGVYASEPGQSEQLLSSGVYETKSETPKPIRLQIPAAADASSRFFIKAGFNNDGEFSIGGISVDATVLGLWNIPLFHIPADQLRNQIDVNPRYTSAQWNEHTAELRTASHSHDIVFNSVQSLAELSQRAGGWKRWLATTINLLGLAFLAFLAWRTDWLISGLRKLAGFTVRSFTRPDVTANGSFTGNGCWIAAGMALLLILVFARSWPNLTHPELYFEDATHHFNYFYGDQQPFTDVFRKPNRYIAFGTYLLAWLTAKLPGATQPYIYLTIAVLGAWITASALSFTGLLRNRLSLLLAPSILGLAGLNHIVFWTTLTYQIFNAVILLLVILLLPAPKTRSGKLLTIVAVTLLIWSGPFSVLTIPVAILLLAFRLFPGKNLILVYSILCAFAYYLTVNTGVTKLTTILGDPRRFYHYGSLLFEDIYFLGILGPVTAGKVLAWMAGMGFLFYRLRKDTVYLKVALVFQTIILMNLALYFLSSKYMLFAHWPNHLTISIFFWLAFLILSIDRLKGHVARIPVTQIAGLAILGWLVISMNLRYPEIRQKEIYAEIPRFLATVNHYEPLTQELRKTNRKLILFTEKHWTLGSPTVVIGNHAMDARQIGSQELGDDFGKEFIAEPEPALDSR